MKIPFLQFTCAALALLSMALIHAGEAPSAADDRAALEIGKALIAVEKAIDYELPENPSPDDLAKSETLTKAAVEAGQITRVYPWVSARIAQEITLAQDRLRDTHPDEKEAGKLNRRIVRLQHLKLLIDAPL